MNNQSVEQTIERIRPYLKEDGGDVELVRVTAEGIVEVRLTGSCTSCPMSMMTLRAGIERALMLAHESVKRVEQVK
ncbi:MAG: NifU family protein [Ignavibacteriales bacterium]|nr:NifU family protein [Ignavibacteriales bacterium]